MALKSRSATNTSSRQLLALVDVEEGDRLVIGVGGYGHQLVLGQENDADGKVDYGKSAHDGAQTTAGEVFLRRMSGDTNYKKREKAPACLVTETSEVDGPRGLGSYELEIHTHDHALQSSSAHRLRGGEEGLWYLARCSVRPGKGGVRW